MKSKTSLITELQKLYADRKNEIIARLKEFRQCWSKSNDEEIFKELAFCLLTPQSKARSCWKAIGQMDEDDVLLKGDADRIRPILKKGVRFHNKKAEYLVKARSLFMKDGGIHIKKFLKSFPDIYACREWLVKNLTGLGYKEAGHFLRNIGSGEKIAILDRHILRNLHALGVIDEFPESLSNKRYLEIEKKMAEFAGSVNIPLDHLDLLLWYKETGEIFK
jgi:N-glycosylase/DNA lyase